MCQKNKIYQKSSNRLFMVTVIFQHYLLASDSTIESYYVFRLF